MKDDMNDDVQIEAEDPEAASKAEDKVAKLKTEIESLRKEKQDYLDGWQRSKADYVNLLKRLEGEVSAAKARGLKDAVEALLPAYDALERAKEHGEVPPGFEAIAKQLESAFSALGLTPFGVVGEFFDPNFHEALAEEKTDAENEDGKILAVLEKGYTLNGTVLRPAKVKVASSN